MTLQIKAAALLAAGLALSTACPARANDSTAELQAGGLVLTRSDDIAMVSEDLYISMDAVRVHYVFRNTGPADRTLTVAFPMPDITGAIDEMPAIADAENANFMKFATTFDGRPVKARAMQQAFFKGENVTGLLTKFAIPFEPFATATRKALAGLPKDVLKDWMNRELILEDTYDAGKGWQTDYDPGWTLKTTYLWEATFPAGRDVIVDHSYVPTAGASAGLSFFGDYPEAAQQLQLYTALYCMDPAFFAALKRRAPKGQLSALPMSETTVSYILTTGANWAGPIGTFHLTVDKGASKNLVSFCGTDVRKTGPTTFELTYKDFTPKTDIAVLILTPWEN